MGFLSWTVNKINVTPNYTEGREEVASESPTYSYQQCYEQIEIVNRAVNMIVDDAAAIKNKIGDPRTTSVVPGVKKKTLDRLLNLEPNPYQDIDSFRRAMILDLIIDGNIFIYFDGVHMYHLPAVKMTVISDPKIYVSGYKYDGGDTFSPKEIIHIKDNTYKTLFRGSSRLEPALRTMRLILEMRKFQDNFFKNGAVPGLVLKTESTLNQRLKDRLTAEWSQKFRPSAGGKRPIILDGGLEIDAISNVSFKDLDFQNAILECEKVVVKAIGVPPVLLDSGNNANLRPNHRLYYLETIIPIMNKINSAMEHFFGFEVYEDTAYIEALRPELQEEAAYYQSLVNGGIMKPNEARVALSLPPDEDPMSDKLRIPANIAGSAANPIEGGAPKKEPTNGK